MASNKLIAIGEALIDFIPQQSGIALKEVSSFMPKVGGAPANVCGAFAKLGGEAMMLTKVGEDAFGERIINYLSENTIDVSHIIRTKEANTGLAFVSLTADGNREFSFYRKPSADMLLAPNEIEKEWFDNAFALHFCSVDLIPCPMKEAHIKAIEFASEKEAMISFDPNIRFPLWESKEALKQTILEFIPKAHILKISDEELEFITGYQTIEAAKEILFRGNVELILFTKGGKGAEAHTKEVQVSVPSQKVKAVDTTGAGDGFIGAFLYKLMLDEVNVQTLPKLKKEQLEEYLKFAHYFCAYSVQREGAISSYPSIEKMNIYK